MSGSRYAELQVTSPFSFLRGASLAEELFATAAMTRRHQPSVSSIIDRSMYSVAHRQPGMHAVPRPLRVQAV